jgi:hypothetical protein
MWMERCPQPRPYVARRHASRAILLDDLCVDLLIWYTIGRAGSPSELPVETAIAVAILESLKLLFILLRLHPNRLGISVLRDLGGDGNVRCV